MKHMKGYTLNTTRDATEVKRLLIKINRTKGVEWIYKASVDDWVCTTSFQVQEEYSEYIEQLLREQGIYFTKD